MTLNEKIEIFDKIIDAALTMIQDDAYIFYRDNIVKAQTKEERDFVWNRSKEIEKISAKNEKKVKEVAALIKMYYLELMED